MSYKCEILADSKNIQGDRITTMKITFPRFILAEFNTHRMFSRNSASSRAIPFNKMVKMVEDNPFIPIAFQKDHKGMQGTEYISTEEGIYVCKRGWLEARDSAVKQAKWLHSCNVTKQLCNRLFEPFMWHTVILTSGKEGLDNFFELRCPEYVVNWYPSYRPEALEPTQASFRSKIDAIVRTEGECDNWTEEKWREANISQAEIHIQAIAEMMWDAYNESKPDFLNLGEWHIPFKDNIDLSHSSFDKFKFEHKALTNEELLDLKVKIATARCARISYETLGDNPKIDYEADIRLHDMLLESKHFSPFEHVARCMSDEEYETNIRGEIDTGFDVPNKTQGWSNNFKGFIQYRHLIDNNI
jgi:hypothetical protein